MVKLGAMKMPTLCSAASFSARSMAFRGNARGADHEMLAASRHGIDCVGGPFSVREVDHDVRVSDYVAERIREGDRAGASGQGERVFLRKLVRAAYRQHVGLLRERGDDLLTHAPQRALNGNSYLLSHRKPPNRAMRPILLGYPDRRAYRRSRPPPRRSGLPSRRESSRRGGLSPPYSRCGPSRRGGLPPSRPRGPPRPAPPGLPLPPDPRLLAATVSMSSSKRRERRDSEIFPCGSMSITCTVSSWPISISSSTDSTRWSDSSLMWTMPSWPGSIWTNAPNPIIRTTFPV